MAGSAALTQEDLPRELERSSVFSGFGSELVGLVARDSTLIELKPSEALSRSAQEPERCYFLLSGQVAVTREVSPGGDEALAKSHRPNPGREYLLHFTEGDFFSDLHLATAGAAASDKALSLVGVMRSALAAVPVRTVKQAMARSPDWARVLKKRNSDLRLHYERHHIGDRRVVMDFFLQHNFSYANTLKVIDLDRCIGCDGCERACATRHGVARLERKGPVLGRLAFPVACRTCVDHRCFHACGFDAISIAAKEEVKIDVQRCVGCAACFSACPNGVISMLEKPYVGADFKEQIPETTLDGQSNVPGVSIVGEATGTALIKLAINSGRRAVEIGAKELAGTAGPAGALDVIIAGAGPAGLSAALTAKELGLSFAIFDKEHFATTIQGYPREKVVMAEPAHIPLFGNLWLKDTTKEELIAKWKEVIKETGLEIKSHEPIESVKCDGDGALTVTTTKGTYRARRVVLATGARGSPRRLGVAGEASPRVQYQLTEPGDFRGKSCLVVGGGDSAVEAAMSLADVPGTKVALSYRKDNFGRIKPRNKSRIDEYAKSGKVQLLLESSVKAIAPGKVTIGLKEGSLELANDQIFAMLGAEPPTKFFESIGIKILQPGSLDMEAFARSRGNRRYASKCDHCSGHSDQACITACPTGAILEVQPAEVFGPPPSATGSREPFSLEQFQEGLARFTAPSGLLRFGQGVAIFSLLLAALIGAECFLRRVIPEWSLLFRYEVLLRRAPEVTFESGRGLGYHLGIAGSSMMLLTALYPLHSRLGLFRRLAKTRFWLAGHILAGVLGPILVTYHTNLKLDRWPSIAFWLMWAVVVTGAIGRHVYTWVRRAHGLSDLGKKRLEADRKKMVDELGATSGHTRIIKVLERSPSKAQSGSALGASLALMFGELTGFVQRLWWKTVTLRNVADRGTRDRALEVLTSRRRQEHRAELFDRLGRSVATWRRVHLGATIVLFLVAVIHIATSMLFGVGG